MYKEVKKTTGLPVICHTTPNMDSWAISRDFSAITVQTGRSERPRSCLWIDSFLKAIKYLLFG